MSDFDKEAEREKLRERFEREDQRREATQRMSDLLLKGATMTNKHCDSCGDPIFRQNDREFCPTCEEQRDGGTDRPTEEADTAARDSETGSATSETGAETASEEPAADEDTRASGQPSADSASRQPQPTAPGDLQGDAREGPTSDSPARIPAASEESAVTLADGETALVEALVRFARLGAAADDPRRARDHLAAAREAAEALEALRN